MILEPVMAKSSTHTSLTPPGSSHVTFEGGAERGEPSERLRKWTQTNLFTIGRWVLATGRENPPFLFFSDSEDVVRRVYSKGPARESRDTPPLDRLLTRDRWETNDTKRTLRYIVGSDEVLAVNRGETLFGE